jgi:hypothetical protein
MRIDPLYMVFAIPRPKRPQHQIGAFRNRKLSQAENAPVFSIPVAYTHMVSMMGTIKSRFFSLFCGEKTTVRTSPLTPEVQEPWEYEDAEVQAACEKTEGPKAPHRDAWAHAGAIAALLRNVDAENEHAMSVQSLFQLYDAAVFRKAEHGKNVPFGWDNGINPGYTVGPPLFWTGSLGPTGSLPKYPLVRYGTASGCLRR